MDGFRWSISHGKQQDFTESCADSPEAVFLAGVRNVTSCSVVARLPSGAHVRKEACQDSKR
eukprot:10442229-Alexandrium_andersonii.AAC.1